jgi:CBS domain-containing protein
MQRTVADVMTRHVVIADAFTPFKEVVRRMQANRVSALPVVDEDDQVLGIVSEGDLILKEDRDLDDDHRRFSSTRHRLERSKAAGLLASQLSTAPAITIGPEASLGEAARLMHRHHVKRLPVVDEQGRLTGIVSRSDLLKVFLRDDAEIAREVREDVIRRTLWMEPQAVTVNVREGVVTLEGQVERRSLIPILERLVISMDGVVAIEPKLSYLEDDRAGVVAFRWGAFPVPHDAGTPSRSAF